MCWVCPIGAAIGGVIGNYIGIPFPRDPKGKMMSTLITVSLIAITLLATKILCNISLCVGGGFTLGNITRVVAKTIILWVIYSIGVNFLLNRYVYPPSSIATNHGCCHQN